MWVWIAISPLIFSGLITSVLGILFLCLISLFMKWRFNKSGKMIWSKMEDWFNSKVIKKAVIGVCMNIVLYLLLLLLFWWINLWMSKDALTKSIWQFIGQLIISFLWIKITLFILGPIIVTLTMFSILMFCLKQYIRLKHDE